MPPLPIESPLLPVRGLGGHALRRVQKLNDTLRRTRALVEKAGEPQSQSIALLLVETRVLILQMGRHEFGRAAGMHFHAVKNVETPGSHPQHESFSRVIRIWTRLATPSAGRPPRVRKQLQEACRKLMDLLVPEKDDHGRPLRSTVDGLYRIWTHEKGQHAFEAASRKTNRQRQALTYGTLWQRRQVGMVPDFEEIRVIGTQLGRDLKHAGEIWEHQKTEQLLQRGVPRPMVRFMVAIQLACPGLHMTAASIRRHLDVSEKTSQAINNGELVRFRDVEKVVRKIFSAKEEADLQREWKDAWEQSSSLEDFTAAFPRICAENGWTNHMLATLLRVRPPEVRGLLKAGVKPSKPTRSESYRPSAEVRRMYQENSFSGQAPALAAIELVARNGIKETGGESQRDYLVRLFLEAIEDRLSRKGSGAHGSPIRRHRILCGVTPKQLASVAGYSSAEILLLERGVRETSAAETKRLLQLIETFPQKKVNEARARLHELNSPSVTIVQSLERLKTRFGGYIPLSRAVQDESDRRLSFTPGRLKRIERGKEVPALPLLSHLLTHAGTEITPELIQDWYDRMPQYLVRHTKLRWRHPLARGFGIIIFEKWHSLRQFWEEQFQEDFSYSIVTRNFQQLNGFRGDFPWTTVSRYLNAAGVGIEDPRRLFLQHVFDRKDEITRAITSRQSDSVSRIVAEILKEWRGELRARNTDPQPIEHTLGLTRAERGLL